MLSRCRKRTIRYVVSSCFFFGIIALASLAGFAGSHALASTQSPFPQPTALEPTVNFWVKVFSDYSYRDLVAHDGNQVWKVYEVIHIPGSGPPNRSEAAYAGEHLKDKYERILYRLAEGLKPRTTTERRVAAMFAGQPLSAYREAAENLKVQQGLRERFAQGMIRSRRYRGIMERIFRREGLPSGLVSLAAIESEFNPRARSYAGAVGIWQFIRSTGRKYLRINRYRDERLDPFIETKAAAKLLKANYEMLGSWPLAITAYDYGAGGMARASAAYGGSYMRILRHYDGRNFGYAVRNYYPEFLAALNIYKHPHRYFPDLKRIPAPLLLADNSQSSNRSYHQRRYRVRPGDTLARIARVYDVSVRNLISVNGVRDPREIRAGMLLSIPGRYESLASASVQRYRVRRGDTLSQIATRSGVSVASLMEANGIRNPRAIRAGLLLSIPGGHSPASFHGRTRVHHYRVERGDTLFEIAERTGVKVRNLMAANGIDNPRELKTGLLLSIPNGRVTESDKHYRVEQGDTLYGIAHRSGISVRTLMEANSIDNPRSLSVGQVLEIPGV